MEDRLLRPSNDPVNSFDPVDGVIVVSPIGAFGVMSTRKNYSEWDFFGAKKPRKLAEIASPIEIWMFINIADVNI